jgi:fucose permease
MPDRKPVSAAWAIAAVVLSGAAIVLWILGQVYENAGQSKVRDYVSLICIAVILGTVLARWRKSR